MTKEEAYQSARLELEKFSAQGFIVALSEHGLAEFGCWSLTMKKSFDYSVKPTESPDG